MTSTPLPVIAPIAQGVDSQSNPYTLYTSSCHLQIADDGGWITPVIATNNGNGTHTFKTNSPFLSQHHQITSQPIAGSFSALLETEYLFALTASDSNAIPNLIDFDNKIADALNVILNRVPNFGFINKINLANIPNLDTSVTVLSFNQAYYAPAMLTNPVGQVLLLLQAFTYAANLYTYNPDLVNAIIPTFLHFKTNLYNLNRQVFLYSIPFILGGNL